MNKIHNTKISFEYDDKFYTRFNEKENIWWLDDEEFMIYLYCEEGWVFYEKIKNEAGSLIDISTYSISNTPSIEMEFQRCLINDL